MPRLNSNATEQNVDGLEEKIKDALPSVVLTTNPVVICGVNRRVGLGHYEHIDIYAGIALPIDMEAVIDKSKIVEAVEQAAEAGFNMVSSETYKRYKLLVDAQKNAPPTEGE